MKYLLILLISVLTISCNSQEKKTTTAEKHNSIVQKKPAQIGAYVTSAFEDSKGNLWFGTLAKGIAHYDGNRLKYFTQKDGLPSNRVTGIIEEPTGVYWLVTGEGLSKYDGKTFTNITVNKDDLSSNMVNQLLIDKKGTFWLGTWNGVYQFDGESFTPFPIPFPKVTTAINEDTKNWITELKEDPEGNIWIARDGSGICKYDGKSFTHYLKKDGLHSNNVTDVEFDKDGHIWFGTRVAEKDNPDPTKRTGKGGVNKLTNERMVSFPEIKGFNNSDVYQIYKESSGLIWISTTTNGVYCYDGKNFKNYELPISIMGMKKDSKGNLWLCGAGGLYKINTKEEIINVTTEGPW